MTDAALGFADHSGWAIAVALVRAGDWFEVAARERLEVLEPGWTLPSAFALPRQPYHAVAEQGVDRDVIRQTIESAADGSEAAIRRLCETLERLGHELRSAGVPVGTSPLPHSLDAILRSHTLLHAAEGELFREALAEGAARCGVAVVRIPRREIAGLAARELDMDLGELEGRLVAMGKALGPPWTADHRLAAAAAIYVLGPSPAGRSASIGS
jgi:hypothetical protein